MLLRLDYIKRGLPRRQARDGRENAVRRPDGARLLAGFLCEFFHQLGSRLQENDGIPGLRLPRDIAQLLRYVD
jgi:hypothetical protein